MTEVHSIWLMPCLDDAQWLAEIVETLSVRFGTPRFAPHLTLLQDREVSSARLAQFWRSRDLPGSLLCQVADVEIGPQYFRSVYARLANHGELAALHAGACLEFGAEGAFLPHVSLAYGVAESASKREARRLLSSGMRGRTLRFDRLGVVGSGKGIPITDWIVRDEIVLV